MATEGFSELQSSIIIDYDIFIIAGDFDFHVGNGPGFNLPSPDVAEKGSSPLGRNP